MEILLSIRSTTEGTVREVTASIDDDLIIGRGAEEGILLDGPDLSREHLKLTTDGTRFFVTDLSSNGTWLNGARLPRAAKTPVKVEDSIEVAGYVLNFRPVAQPEKTGDAAVSNAPQPAPELVVAAPLAPEQAKPKGLLDPVFHFLGSFTFMEKVWILAGFGGLALLYTYVAL